MPAPTPEEMAAQAAQAAQAVYANRTSRPKGTSNIGIEHFKSGVDDFDEWVVLFESAVNLATMATTLAEKHASYWEWLPLRLDKPARAMHAQAKDQVQAHARAQNPVRDATWPELRTALESLLIDPLEGHKWHAKLMTIKWDGIESLHVFASRVISAVNKFDKNMDETYKEREYFLRFRMGLPTQPYQDAIDLNVGFEGGTLEKAKLVALRVQLTQMNTGKEQKQVGFANALMPSNYGNVSSSDQYVAMAAPSGPKDSSAQPSKVYGNASMQDNRTSSLEASLAGIHTKLENISVDMRSSDSRLTTLEKDVEAMKRPGNPAPNMTPNMNPNFWPPQNQGQWYQPNFWQPQGYATGYTAPFRPPSPHRSASPHRSNHQPRPLSPHRSNQQYRSPSPRHATQYQQQPQHQSQQPQYQNPQYRSQSPNRSGHQGRPQSPRSSQRGPSPNRSGQKFYPPSPGKLHPSTTHPKYQQSGTQHDQFRAIDTGDEASGYESGVDPDAEIARLHEEMERMKEMKAKRKGN